MLERLGNLPGSSDTAVLFAALQIRGYIHGTGGVLHRMFFGYESLGPVFSRENLQGISPANGERLFCLLLIGIIRHCTNSDPKEGDMFCELAEMIMPENVKPAARRLAGAMRNGGMNECRAKLHSIFEQLFGTLNPLMEMRISGCCILPMCAALNLERKSHLQALGLD